MFCLFQEEKYLTIFNFCSFDPRWMILLYFKLLYLAWRKQRFWRVRVCVWAGWMFRGWQCKTFREVLGCLISVMWRPSQGYSSSVFTCDHLWAVVAMQMQLNLNGIATNGDVRCCNNSSLLTFCSYRLDKHTPMSLHLRLYGTLNTPQHKEMIKIKHKSPQYRFHTFEPICFLFFSSQKVSKSVSSSSRSRISYTNKSQSLLSWRVGPCWTAGRPGGLPASL